MIVLTRYRDEKTLEEMVEVSGTVLLRDVFDVARAFPEGRLYLDACSQPDVSMGDRLRLLAFYCDRKDGVT